MSPDLVSWQTLQLLLPEIILVLIATAIYVGGSLVSARRGWTWMALAGVALSAWALAEQHSLPAVQDTVLATEPGALASGPVLLDPFAWTVRWLALAVSLGLALILVPREAEQEAPELLGSLLLIAAGAMLVSVAGNLVFLFLGLELISIPTYVVLYLGRDDAGAHEAATKYFFLSVLSSAVLLYGFSFLYGMSGSVRLADIFALHSDSSVAPALPRLALVLIFSALALRLAAVPFHFYAPDVYQGTSHEFAGLLAVVPKIAGLAALVRLVLWAMPGIGAEGWVLTMTVSVLTMTLGNVLGLWQSHVRRLLAYSSIAHAGYLLIGLTVAFDASGASGDSAVGLDGVAAALFYVLVYSVATLGAFAALACGASRERPLETLDDLAGLGRTQPALAAALALFMFSLAGLPPLAGFWGKFALVAGALAVDDAGRQPWFLALAIITVVNAVISAGYYLRVVAAMYFRAPQQSASATSRLGPALASYACAVLVLALGLYPRPAIEQAKWASALGPTALRQPAASAAVKNSMGVRADDRTLARPR